MNRHFACISVMVTVDYGNTRLDVGDLSGKKGTNPKDDPDLGNGRRIENVSFQWGFRIHFYVCVYVREREREREKGVLFKF